MDATGTLRVCLVSFLDVLFKLDFDLFDVARPDSSLPLDINRGTCGHRNADLEPQQVVTLGGTATGKDRSFSIAPLYPRPERFSTCSTPSPFASLPTGGEQVLSTRSFTPITSRGLHLLQ